jgi:hypothetical protein
MDRTATWWWSGELPGSINPLESGKAWIAFFEVFPKNATEDAVLRVSLSDGRLAWQVCTTKLEIITKHTPARNDVISTLKAILHGKESGSVTVNESTDNRTCPQIVVRRGDKVIACAEMTTSSDPDTVATLLLTYLVHLGSQTRTEESLLQSVRDDRAQLLQMLQRDVDARKRQDKDMADRMRRLLMSKQGHYQA